MMHMLYRALAGTLVALVWTSQALAIDAKNQERLAEHFAAIGPVYYELYAPLGGPDVGGAIIDQGDGSGRLYISIIADKKTRDLIVEPVPQLSASSVFTFLLTGYHVLVYPTREWLDDKGQQHRRGDLRVYEITSGEEPVQLFELRDVHDLTFQAGGAMTNDNLVWQPCSHFLNQSGMLPVKNNYFKFRFDPAENEYYLAQHLTALPDANTIDAANLNNRALLYYRDHRLSEASLLLKQANDVAQSSQSVILRNRALVLSEIEDLAAQAEMIPDRPSDEALRYFWQGDYQGVLGIMDTRGRTGFTAYESALLGLSLAHEGRWPESDRITEAFKLKSEPFLADYLWELVKIADSQEHPEIAEVKLLALEETNSNHPGFIVGLSGLLGKIGETDQAKQLLEHYVNSPGNAGRLREPRFALFEMYYRQADTIGCNRLIENALAAPVTDLQDYVLLADYTDLSTALSKIPVDSSGRIKAPEEPLETVTIQ